MRDLAPPDRSPLPALGLHLLADLHGARGLGDEALMRHALGACVAAAGATLLGLHVHRFQPQGLTGVALLAESHITFHTWPETGFAAFDIFLCGACDPHAAVPVLRSAFAPRRLEVSAHRRGTAPTGDAAPGRGPQPDAGGIE